MKKCTLLTSLTMLTFVFVPQLLYANPPSTLGYIDATIGVKNNTGDNIQVSCEVGSNHQGNWQLGGPQTISSGGAYTFTGLAGDSCSTGNNQIVCNYTDTSTGNTGTFTVGACQNANSGWPISYSNSLKAEANGTPPEAYKCTASKADYGNYNPGKQCSSGNWSASGYTCIVEAYFAVGADSADNNTYRFTWDEVDLPPTTGQAMTDKLARSLSQTGNYGRVTGSYDKPNKKITIKLPPPDPTDPNPYDGMTSLSQCRNACVPSQ